MDVVAEHKGAGFVYWDFRNNWVNRHWTFGPDGLSTRQMSYTGKAIVNSLNPGDHTTIQALFATASQYEFILHPGDFACESVCPPPLIVVLILSPKMRTRGSRVPFNSTLARTNS